MQQPGQNKVGFYKATTLVYISRFTHFGRKSNKAALPQPLLSGPRPGCHQAGRMAGMAFELTRLKMPELL